MKVDCRRCGKDWRQGERKEERERKRGGGGSLKEKERVRELK